MSDSENGRDECRHGRLRRACEICQRDDDMIATLRKEARAFLAELDSKVSRLTDLMEAT